MQWPPRIITGGKERLETFLNVHYHRITELFRVEKTLKTSLACSVGGWCVAEGGWSWDVRRHGGTKFLLSRTRRSCSGVCFSENHRALTCTSVLQLPLWEITESWYKMVWAGRDFKEHLVPPPCYVPSYFMVYYWSCRSLGASPMLCYHPRPQTSFLCATGANPNFYEMAQCSQSPKWIKEKGNNAREVLWGFTCRGSNAITKSRWKVRCWGRNNAQ